MEPEELTYQFLQEITDGFSEERKVGQGGFGTVYKGVTKHGEDVAVKILRDGSNPDLDFKKFQNEFYNLTKVKHDNIVQFLGYCYEIEPKHMECDGRIVRVEETHRALCFEYLHNGSLQNHLFDESCGLYNYWHTRFQIIKGTCEGLRYIHEEESLLHLDLKPDNILLDKDMVPKIADFGLSRIFGDQPIWASESSFGTLGYKPPEYINEKRISKKFDIFSLGIIIIRIVSGQEGYPKCLDMLSDEFIDQVQRNWKEKLQETCSGSLLEAFCRQVKTCTRVALDCLEEDSQRRPDIVKIIDRLKEIGPNNCKPPQERWKTTVCGMNNEIKLRKQHRAITDQQEDSDFMISSRIIENQSDNAKETSLDVGKDLIVGREEKKKRMASLLENMSEKIIILPICGIGGIGKTTFARLIYSDANFKHYSQVWVYVSSRFDLCKIGNSIISQLSGMENQDNELQIIKSCLTRLFSGKKILIVLDGLWENNTIQLVNLKEMLNPSDSIKTIVLVTTRSEDIAKKICSNIEPYKIESLTDDMCWDIIKQKSAFEARHDKEKLVSIGKEIARKCGGVALAAQTLGSMLQSMKYDQWMIVKDSDIWNETISNDASLANNVLASLKLSYFNMDDCLKSCFTYCAIFPKGHVIVKCDLIYQWLSLGFIKPTKMFSTYQLCEKYIVHLLGLTFLQHSMSPTTYGTYSEDGTMFTMHDLVHDLAVSVLGDRILDQSKQVNTWRSCSYALLTDCSKPLESCMTSPAGLSALRFQDCWRTQLHGAAFEPAKSLRVLDLNECLIQKFPDSIGRLKQLRYLNAPRIRHHMIPECITKLSNLRYLKLCGSWAILALPESIGEMEGLIHLDLSGCIGIGELPKSFGDLKSLEHLDFINCRNVMGVSQCLGRLTKLQHLNLSNCENIGGLPRALGSPTELKYLNLKNSSYLFRNEHADAEFLGSLTKLKYLDLSSSDNLATIRLCEAIGSITELEYLNLSHNSMSGKLPASIGSLCNLVHLDLSLCYFLRDVPAALNGLTKLQYLDLRECSIFCAMEMEEGLHEVLGHLSELRHLDLGFCFNVAVALPYQYNPNTINSLLKRICTLTNLEYLNLRGNGDIYIIPETLANLRKLHTLDLTRCRNLRRLPASISELVSLKFLHTMGCWKLHSSTVPQYNTGDGDGESSSFRFQLNYKTPTQLKISRLEYVKSEREARTIKLVEKTGITRLALEWTKDAKRFVDDAEVLRELEPPISVSEFHLEGYNSFSFPSWVMQISLYLTDLTRIELSDLPSCNNLPPLGQLPNLRKLGIERMNVIKKIGMDLYGGTRAFPRLEEFSIVGMKCLEEWRTAYSTDEGDLDESTFPCLSYLHILYCQRLRFEPRPPRSRHGKFKLLIECSDEVILSPCRNIGHAAASTVTKLRVSECSLPLHRWSLLRHLPCLQDLRIINCSDLTCSSPGFLQRLTSLTQLEILESDEWRQNWKRCGRIKSLPKGLGGLPSLTVLKIVDCWSIKTLPGSIQRLTCLQTLIVKGCKSMVSLPEGLGSLASLMVLEIRGCESIKTLPGSIQQLTCLQTLIVKGCKSMVSLPEGLGSIASLMVLEIRGCQIIKTLPGSIQQLTCLQTLIVQGCKSIVSLPEGLGDLTCLEILTVEDCESIVSLPDRLGDLTSLMKLSIRNCKGIKTLPDTIAQLTCLRELYILKCPKLGRWCKSKENKKKLAHIKEVFVDWELINKKTRKLIISGQKTRTRKSSGGNKIQWVQLAWLQKCLAPHYLPKINRVLSGAKRL